MMSMYTTIPAPSLMKNMSSEHFLSTINSTISSYSWLLPMNTFTRSVYVCENQYSHVISEFKLDCANLGNKQPRQGYDRQPTCPVCPGNVPNTTMHMLFCCSSVSGLRHLTGIQSFMTQCQLHGLSLTEAFKYFVNGLTWRGDPVDRQEYLERGKSMNDMRDLWLSKW